VSICVEKTKSKVRMSRSVEKALHRVWISSCTFRKDSVQSLDKQLYRKDSVQSLDKQLYKRQCAESG
jgi:hypothetical protein